MKKITVLFCSFFIASSTFADAAPERLISLKPNITEIVFALGAGKKLVGVTTYCNRPLEASKLPQVADYIAPSLEKVIALQPDLILSSHENSSAQQVLRLQDLGYELRFFNFSNLQNTPSSIQEIGKALQTKASANQLVAELRQDLAQIKIKAPAQKPRVLFVIGTHPLIAAGQNTLLAELLAIAGGQNVLGKKYTAYPRLNEEDLLMLQPDVIFTLYMEKPLRATPWEKFQQIPAVQHKRIYTLNIDDFRAGPNLANAAQQLQNLLTNVPSK